MRVFIYSENCFHILKANTAKLAKLIGHGPAGPRCCGRMQVTSLVLEGFSIWCPFKGFQEISCCAYTFMPQFIPISVCVWSLDSRDSWNVFNQNMFDEKWGFCQKLTLHGIKINHLHQNCPIHQKKDWNQNIYSKEKQGRKVLNGNFLVFIVYVDT